MSPNEYSKYCNIINSGDYSFTKPNRMAYDMILEHWEDEFFILFIDLMNPDVKKKFVESPSKVMRQFVEFIKNKFKNELDGCLIVPKFCDGLIHQYSIQI